MRKTILIGSIAVSVLILLSSLPSVYASQTYKPLEIPPEISEQLVNILKDINGGFPLEWEPGLIMLILKKVIEIYIDYLINDGWFPGVTLAFMYVFLVLVVFGLILNEPDIRFLNRPITISDIF